MKHCLASLLCLFCTFLSFGQREPDQVYMENIRTVQLTLYGNPVSYPVFNLGTNDLLQLDFDDLDGGVKSYYYTFELRNADWSSVPMGYFDYLKGFVNQRIFTYRPSAQTFTRYTHYQLSFPDRNLMPTKPGNYILKVFLNGDTAQLAFTRRFLVVSNQISVSAQIQQPFNQQYFRTHQKVQLAVNANRLQVSYPQQQIKVVILQNQRWDSRILNTQPSIVRNNYFEYNTENDFLMPAGKEWRWLDLRSFRLLSDRVRRQANTDNSYELFVTPDLPRANLRYIYWQDYNGLFIQENNDGTNPYWNSDYATVNFTYVPPGRQPYTDSDIYLFGALTNYGKQGAARMIWNTDSSAYTTTLFLKQGYYDYAFALRKAGTPGPFDLKTAEGEAWETENNYIILVYFRELGGRYDQLLGYVELNSQFNRPGDLN